MRNVKGFLKDGEFEWYRGTEVEYRSGRKAVLYIYEDGVEVEQVMLHEYDALGKEAMHEMMAEKGFVRRTEEEIREVGEAAERRKKEERDDKIRRAKEKNELREKARAERLEAGADAAAAAAAAAADAADAPPSEGAAAVGSEL